MKKKVALVLLLVFTLTLILTGCGPKRNVAGLKDQLVAAGYNDESFVVLDNLLMKAILKLFDMKALMIYAEGNNAFLVLESKELMSEEQIINKTTGFLTELDPSMLGAEMGDMTEVMKQLESAPDMAADYIDVNTTFILIHSNTDSTLLSIFNAY